MKAKELSRVVSCLRGTFTASDLETVRGMIREAEEKLVALKVLESAIAARATSSGAQPEATIRRVQLGRRRRVKDHVPSGEVQKRKNHVEFVSQTRQVPNLKSDAEPCVNRVLKYLLHSEG